MHLKKINFPLFFFSALRLPQDGDSDDDTLPEGRRNKELRVWPAGATRTLSPSVLHSLR